MVCKWDLSTKSWIKFWAGIAITSNANETNYNTQINYSCDWNFLIAFETLIDRWSKSKHMGMAVKGKDSFACKNTHRVELFLF